MSSNKLHLDVERCFNEKMGRELYYLSVGDVTKTGRVENHLICDEKNLFYRDDKSKKISVFPGISFTSVNADIRKRISCSSETFLNIEQAS